MGRAYPGILLLAALLSVPAGCAGRPVTAAGIGASAPAEDHLGAIRREYGLPPALPDPLLEKAAAEQARYMAEAGRMEHATGPGRDFATRMRENAVRSPAAENIAHGRMDMAELFRRWADSPPHRKNMLDPRFRHFGLASAADASGRRYWALVMGE